ncbi:3',5'-cyclic AMP phosphodiesterase CpdA [Rhodobacter viridis]|uniref:3',5'-cyclic AMP phosphodiesterase CpdA n=1 Tax=Rhodobacter viridis TaxID=1054202 RepID=A0A318TTD5_9RHOB|nr:metallophosphoesterase [Rhodobacter viridis]PYF08111.1 3',5'-cyclic AMP phosphodiesterase CpdA [Rhodobacter viridis]
MIRLLHLSDLHFGRTHPELIAPLVAAVQRLAPDLVLLSGDITQRAREAQFRQAQAFLDRIERPWLAVPGNHDIPLDRPVLRFLRPFGGYRAAICDDLYPVRELPGVTVLGFNTATPRHWQAGRIRRGGFATLLARVRKAVQAGRQVVVVAHHPFTQPDDSDKTLLAGAADALEAMAEAGVGMLCTGHLHLWRTQPFVTREGAARVLQLQVGTGLSTRERGEPNDFGVIDLAPDRAEITRFTPAGVVGFARAGRVVFARADGLWRRTDEIRPAARPMTCRAG